MTDSLTAKEVIEQSGVTPRQLDYWCTNHVVLPIGDPKPGSGLQRHFEPDVVARVKTLVKCQAAFQNSLSTDTLRKIYTAWWAGKLQLGPGIWIVWT